MLNEKLLKVLLIIIGIIVALMIAWMLLLIWASKKPAVQPNYYENIVTDKPLEQKYTDKGT